MGLLEPKAQCRMVYSQEKKTLGRLNKHLVRLLLFIRLQNRPQRRRDVFECLGPRKRALWCVFKLGGMAMLGV
jgi:hypothetical protein